ncbi:hypothetical protein C0J52_03993 [Blattella germanica]|nr:hypothetical protein C0J52_03993 [Blattella germanica]
MYSEDIYPSFNMHRYSSMELGQLLKQQRLPKAFKPINYVLKLCPDLNKHYFEGTVKITMNCLETTKDVILHSSNHLRVSYNDIKLTLFSESPENAREIELPCVSKNPSAETLILTAVEELQVDCVYELYFPFTGNYSNPGLFKDDRDPDNESWVLDYFSRTPPISTFSVNILISDFKNGDVIQIPTPEGNFSLQFHAEDEDLLGSQILEAVHVPGTLKFIGDFVGIGYPLPKLDVAFTYGLSFATQTNAIGEWVFRMINAALTEETFRAGLKQFFSDNLYGTFTEKLFWATLEKQAKKDGKLPDTFCLEDVAKCWLSGKTYHYPVLTVTRDYCIFLLQESEDDELTEEEKTFIWWLPIMYLTPNKLDPKAIETIKWTNEKSSTITDLPDANSFIIVNPTDEGTFFLHHD